MPLSLFNTASGEVEEFRPYDKDLVRLYVCGPTVYDRIHLGNARSLVVFDLVARTLRRHYKKLLYVRNITDVDDKILARAREEGVKPSLLTARTIASFHADACALGCIEPDEEPRATEHIESMITMIERLLANGNAYTSDDGHVLFSVRSFEGYGKLSRRGSADCLEDNLDGARVAPLPCRREEGDFVLWKPATEHEEGWNSPWGDGRRGRPGWHIECSAMSRMHLGGKIDLHGGGQDLIFPHHENEIAQSRAAHPDEPFVKHWMHHGYVLCEGKKMSKSLGNFHCVRDLLQRVSGEAIRLTLLRAHYRHPLDFSMQRLCESEKNLDRLYKHASLADGKEADASALPDKTAKAFKGVEEALSQDLNTPLALECLFFLAGYASESKGAEQTHAARAIRHAGGLLGLLQDECRLKAAREGGSASLDSLSAKERAWIEERLAARESARAQRDFAIADAIRLELASQGIEIEDGREGPCWRVVHETKRKPTQDTMRENAIKEDARKEDTRKEAR